MPVGADNNDLMVNKKAALVKPFLKTQISLALMAACGLAVAENPASANVKNNHTGFKFPSFQTCPTDSTQLLVASQPQATVQQQIGPGYIQVHSDQAYSEGNFTYLSGNVIVSQQGQSLRANKLTANKAAQSYTAEGDLTVQNGDFMVSADNLFYQAESGSSQIENTRFHLYSNNGNGSAKSITLDNKQILTLYDSQFSTCPEQQRSWLFESEKIEIDNQSGWGKAYGSVVKIADIPVFYLPYITFPVDDRRKTGLLPPAFSNSSRNGLDLSAPYYFNLAENYDLTLIPRHISKRGAMLSGEFRYLAQDMAGELQLSYLPSDNLFAQETNGSSDRWQYNIKHSSQFGTNWSATVDAQKVSDDAYFQDFGGGVINSNQDSLSQQFSVKYLTNEWLFQTQYQDWQLLNSSSERYKIAPRVELNRYFEPQASGFYANINSQFTRFENDQETIESANRYHIEPTIGWNLESLYGFIRPQVSYALTRYQQTLQNKEQDSFSRSLPTVSVDSGLFFERTLNFAGNDYTQTFEPRALYLYTPFKSQDNIGLFDTSLPTFNFTQLFSRNRFSGIDRIGDTSQVSGAITSRVLDSQGKEKLAVSLGRIVYLKDRKVQLSDSLPIERFRQSGLLAEINWRWIDSLEINSTIEWDDQTNSTAQGLVSAHYEPKPNHIINLSHRYRKSFNRKLEEAELSFAWPIKDNWRVLGRYSRDLAENRTNDSFFGLEYESCCWAVRVVSRRYLNIQLDSEGFVIAGQGDQHNSGVFLQFVLKGIGSLRGSTTQFLEDNIYGYRDILGH